MPNEEGRIEPGKRRDLKRKTSAKRRVNRSNDEASEDGSDAEPQQNTILNDLWDETFTKDRAILESLILQDRLDALAAMEKQKQLSADEIVQ